MPDLKMEQELIRSGMDPVAGIDEAGRGPLAGPVTAAAVILPCGYEHALLDDSKKLTARSRDLIYEELTSDPSICWGVAFAEVEEIDALNILRATHTAMRRAAMALSARPSFCLIDGLDVPGFPLDARGVVKGDGISLSIAAASIIAKVSRDRRMQELAEEFPVYGFEKHKGYGTKAHLEALREHGPCPEHRRSFAPVAELAG
ncbi:MAG TPA: ribonuclease HII [Verrucomicrobiales bacterium]|nr:ribonuclease HII [Roseibacillus sp.]HCQ33037.1 ribonuclease HII [Verrucomicrobiales bacterium]|tara:strand:- start:190 stop:798 length:609 start_codon:yes stop_codon:yes gene_type:complete